MNQHELRSCVAAAGWRIERNPLRDEFNECDWYAWQSKRPPDWPDCECNDKPPSMTMWPSFGHLPGAREFGSVEFEVNGEMGGRWFQLRMYSVKPDEAMRAADEAVTALGAAWKALAAQKEQAE